MIKKKEKNFLILFGIFISLIVFALLIAKYSEFREKRYSIRKRNKSIKGLALTDTLDRYAQTGKEYTDILEQIIKQNNLSDFETVQLTNSVVKKDIQL